MLNTYEESRQVNLECLSAKRLEKLDNDVKLFWLMAKHRVHDSLYEGDGFHESNSIITHKRAGTLAEWLKM